MSEPRGDLLDLMDHARLPMEGSAGTQLPSDDQPMAEAAHAHGLDVAAPS